jgi:hypothetical protein
MIDLETPAKRTIWSASRKKTNRIPIETRAVEVAGGDGAGISRFLILLALQARAKGRPVLFLHDRWDEDTRGALVFFGFSIGRTEACVRELPHYRSGIWERDIDCYLDTISLSLAFAKDHPDGLIIIDKRVAVEKKPVNNALASEILANLNGSNNGGIQVVSAGRNSESGPNKTIILGSVFNCCIPKPIVSNGKIKDRIACLNAGEFLAISGVELVPVTVPDMILPGDSQPIHSPLIRLPGG